MILAEISREILVRPGRNFLQLCVFSQREFVLALIEDSLHRHLGRDWLNKLHGEG